MSLADQVRRTVQKYELLAPGGRVVVALSGGADSVALLCLARDLATAGDLTIAGVAHFNHQLRGPEADADEDFCRALAGEAGLPFEAGRGDVRAAAKRAGRSIEDMAREVRYRFLEDAARRLDAEAVAVAHTLDDQAETFLLRLLRGSGPRGLAGIRPKAGLVIRPLLEVRRAALRTFLSERGLVHREDATNANLSVPRNRVRHELLPYLARHFSPGIVEVLAREAAIAREDEDHLASEAIDLAGRIVLQPSDADGGANIDAAALTSLPPAQAARVVRLALERGAPGRFTGFEHIGRFLEFARSAPDGSAVSLPGQRAVKQGGAVRLEPDSRRGSSRANPFCVSLSIPGEVVLPVHGWAVAALHSPEGVAAPGDLSVRILASAVQTPLVVRSRRPGDVVRPAGMQGRRKKLQDVFVDRKVPRHVRDSVPLIVDAAGQIVWVVGCVVGEGLLPPDASAGVILLKARRLGGCG